MKPVNKYLTTEQIVEINRRREADNHRAIKRKIKKDIALLTGFLIIMTVIFYLSF